MVSERLTRGVLKLLPVTPLLASHPGPLLPYYHSVSDETPAHLRHLYQSRSIRAFTNDVVWLLRHGTPVCLEEVLASVRQGRRLKPGSFHLSFDDGLRECYEVAAPILRRMGVPATFFLCSDFLDNRGMFYRNKISILLHFTRSLTASEQEGLRRLFQEEGIPWRGFCGTMAGLPFHRRAVVDRVAALLQCDLAGYLQKERPYLSSAQVTELVGQGFTIGAHSMDHPLYRELVLEEQIRQTRQSMDRLLARFPVSCRAFAFPHTDAEVSLRFFEALEPHVDLFFGTSRMRGDSFPRCLQRFSLEDSRFSCAEITKGNLVRKTVDVILGRDLIDRKR